jgi:hypothetical protein
MLKPLIVIFVTLIILAVLVQAKLIRMSTPSAEMFLVKNHQNPEKENYYRDFWIKNKDKIKETFNPYIDSFYALNCMDQVGLRQQINPTSRIIALSNELTSNSSDSLDVAFNLHQYVYKNIDYEITDGSFNAEQILDLERGDCSEKSILLASLLISKNIPTYVANTPNHRYLFVNIDGIWLPIDPTVSDFYFVYDIWKNEPSLKNYYTSQDSQIFMFNQTHTIFNKKWC